MNGGNGELLTAASTVSYVSGPAPDILVLVAERGNLRGRTLLLYLQTN